MSHQETLPGIPSVTSSPESVYGATLYDELVGQMTGPSGPEVVRANLSARQARKLGLMTSGTFGRTSSGSSSSAALQSSLESRLMQRLDMDGGI